MEMEASPQGCLPCQLRGTPAEQGAYDIKRDLTAGTTAFAFPLGYHYLAPKKWKRLGKAGNVATVVGLYFLTSWIYGKVTT